MKLPDNIGIIIVAIVMLAFMAKFYVELNKEKQKDHQHPKHRLKQYHLKQHRKQSYKQRHWQQEDQMSSEGTKTDPVCGAEISIDTGYQTAYKEQVYKFCSQDCLTEFEESPDDYT